MEPIIFRRNGGNSTWPKCGQRRKRLVEPLLVFRTMPLSKKDKFAEEVERLIETVLPKSTSKRKAECTPKEWAAHVKARRIRASMRSETQKEKDRERSRRNYETNKSRYKKQQSDWRIQNAQRKKDADKKYRKQNKLKISEQKKKWEQEHRTVIRQKQRERYERNKDRINQNARARRAKDPDAQRAYNRAYRAANATRLRRKAKEYRESHQAEIQAYHKAYAEANKEALKQKRKESRLKKLDAIREKERIYRAENREKQRESAKKTYEKNKKRYFEQIRQRRLENPKLKLVANLRSRLSTFIQKVRSKELGISNRRFSSIKDLGCSVDFLVQYLEKQFDKHMTWENYGKYWTIDHIYPLDRIDFSNNSEARAVSNFRNLQPLRTAQNIRKGNRVTKSTERAFMKLVRMLDSEKQPSR